MPGSIDCLPVGEAQKEELARRIEEATGSGCRAE